MGIVPLFPNIRGSSGFGKSFLELDNGLRREDALRDLGALLDWIATRPDLDADGVVVSGFSYGGYMTLSMAATYADRIRGAIDTVGPTNLVTFLETTAPYRRVLRRTEYGDERDPTVRAFLERIAPVNQSAKIRKPLLVFQGANDHAVPRAEAELIEAVRRKRHPALVRPRHRRRPRVPQTPQQGVRVVFDGDVFAGVFGAVEPSGKQLLAYFLIRPCRGREMFVPCHSQ